MGTRQAAGCPGAQAVLQQAGVERGWGPAGGWAGGLAGGQVGWWLLLCSNWLPTSLS